MQGIKEFNYNISTGSVKVLVKSNQTSGSLIVNNGAASTIRGEVSSGKLEIKN